ncbi:MAG TPA: GMC family oxidoreductase [Candidatus Eisenbacteria bacterium]|nr:GMC family oxidoreductase [Candidatus Eisenbacteria bacterium]
MRKRKQENVLGNTGLTHFDVCIIGSGAGGGTAAHVLTAGGKNVLVLETGPLTYDFLDDPKRDPVPLHSNDEVKYEVRMWIDPIADLDPRTFRQGASGPATLNEDVNQLPRLVGGAFGHADVKTPRFTKVDFRLKTAVEELIGATPMLAVPGFGSDSASANFADWPFSYDDLEPFYTEIEQLYGVQGAEDNPYASTRSKPYPMPPGVPMYLGLKLAAGCMATSLDGRVLTPHHFPATAASQFYDGRPPCVDCGMCSGFGCPNNSKGAPAVVTLRKALLSGRCQLRYNATVMRLGVAGGRVTDVEYVDADGAPQTASADAFILAASAIESARLALLSGVPSASGQIGRNLMFHLQTNVNGFSPERIHGQRGRAVTHGVSDFRGVEPGGEALRVFSTPDGPRLRLGGVCEFGGSQGLPITEDGWVYALQLGVAPGQALKNALRDGALGQHLFGLIMQAEDAPQLANQIDLDPTVKDVFGRPAARVSYDTHPFEKETRDFYIPFLREVVTKAGGTNAFITPCDLALGAPTSRHVMGTLRMGSDPATSVVDAGGKFHEVENLYTCDGSVFVTSSGWNPTLTLMAVAAKIAHGIAGTPPVLL